MNAIIDSEMRSAEIEIKAWTCPGTSLDTMTSGLLDGYLIRSESERLAYVAALVGRLMVAEARKRSLQSERASAND
jgi:hypothetical protein